MSTVKIISFAGRLSRGKFSLIKASRDNTTNANFVRHIHKVMKNWQEEKDNFLSMSLDKKRDYYKCREYVKPEQIPTWKEYAAQNRDKLAQKIPVSPGCDIKSSMNSTLAEKISVFRGDITTLEVDCIVNAANSSLLGGGGVDGAIHSAAGPLLKEECRTLCGCDVGEAKITGGYKLPAKYVIHTVGPRGEKPDFLKRCYKNSLHIMSQEKLRTIAFPCVSTGIYGYPIEPASHVAVYEVRKHLESNSDNVDRIIFCLFSAEDEVVYQGVLQSYFPLD